MKAGLVIYSFVVLSSYLSFVSLRRAYIFFTFKAICGNSLRGGDIGVGEEANIFLLGLFEDGAMGVLEGSNMKGVTSGRGEGVRLL